MNELIGKDWIFSWSFRIENPGPDDAALMFELMHNKNKYHFKEMGYYYGGMNKSIQGYIIIEEDKYAFIKNILLCDDKRDGRNCVISPIYFDWHKFKNLWYRKNESGVIKRGYVEISK